MAHSLVSKYYCDAWLNSGGIGVARVAPHEDHEVSLNRSKCLKRFFPNETNMRKAFSNGFEYFSQAHLASSSCCERNWSTYSVTQSVKRNRQATSQAEDLVFVHCNLRPLSRKSKEYTERPSKYWDISGDQFDIDGQEAAELAQLSLDEPDLEGMMFQEVKESEEQLDGDEC
ncbi:hypothetical protein Vadar_026075 [Vaccinium darrowii]|nr:hypothetical protein Vadar_026075 [Vaccinium darrowii]